MIHYLRDDALEMAEPFLQHPLVLAFADLTFCTEVGPWLAVAFQDMNIIERLKSNSLLSNWSAMLACVTRESTDRRHDQVSKIDRMIVLS